jgi:hypothetical protein
MSTHISTGPRAWRRVSVFVAGVALAACSSILDVENPNNVTENALDNPAAAANIVNGLIGATARMLSGTTTPYASSTDELDWTGSRDAWLQLERGAISDYFNEFTDQAFPFVGEARYLGDEAIRRLKNFDGAGTLSNRALLAQAYLYTAVVYASIADMYDDYSFSSKTTAAPPIGRAAMVTLYDKAIAYLDTANTIANSASGAAFTALRYPILAYRARAKHGRAVWQSITPKLAVGAARPLSLINQAGANADAAAAILLGSPDEAFTLANSVGSAAGINIWFEVNGRNEHRTGIYYRNLVDPVTGALDVRMQALLAQFAAFGTQAGTFTLTSTRELRLILAEAALASGNNAEVQNQINLVRALDGGRTAWNGSAPAPLAMLQYERSVQLWLMRRRLSDMHRFNLTDAKWTTVPNYESVVNVNGLLFPIPQIERLGNPCINDPASC